MIPWEEVWELQGTEEQRDIARVALDRGVFPWNLLLPGFRERVGKERIPLDWQDLSQFAKAAPTDIHEHEEAHVLMRERPLGLAWYAGRVTLDVSLVDDHELAGEVLWSEGAHMTDFFWMYFHPEMYEEIFFLFHGGDPTEHEHAWFDMGTYREEVGEAFMGAFTRAYSDYPVTIPFAHAMPDASLPEMHRILMRPAYFSTKGSKVFHDRHYRLRPQRWYPTREEADENLRPCGVCRP